VDDSTLAEDVFQATFLAVYQRAEQFKEGHPFRPWLYAIATNQAIDAMRRAGRRKALSLEELSDPGGANSGATGSSVLYDTRQPGPVEHLQAEEARQRVRAIVEQLPDHLKSTLILAYYQGLKYREIAEILDIPVGTVKSRVHLALARVQEALGNIQDHVP
jgi:RNA polymerase sigma-70 factor (ECF subfamily)